MWFLPHSGVGGGSSRQSSDGAQVEPRLLPLLHIHVCSEGGELPEVSPSVPTEEQQLSASSFDLLMRRLLHTCREETHSANQWAAQRGLKPPPLVFLIQSSNVLLIYCECLMMTQINTYTYPGVSSGAFSYPAGFSHTNLKIQWTVFRATFLFLSVQED